VQDRTHVWFRNLSSVSENIASELAETHALTVRQHSCFNFWEIGWVGKCKVLWTPPQCCPYFLKIRAVQIRRLSEIWGLHPTHIIDMIYWSNRLLARLWTLHNMAMQRLNARQFVAMVVGSCVMINLTFIARLYAWRRICVCVCLCL
jgi:hypothetical protein